MSFPNAHEVEAWGEPTFRMRNKMFAMFASPGSHHGAGRTAVWIKARAEDRDLLVRASPRQYFVPAYMGPSGWVGAYLDGEVDWQEVETLLLAGYQMLAPRKRKI